MWTETRFHRWRNRLFFLRRQRLRLIAKNSLFPSGTKHLVEVKEAIKREKKKSWPHEWKTQCGRCVGKERAESEVVQPAKLRAADLGMGGGESYISLAVTDTESPLICGSGRGEKGETAFALSLAAREKVAERGRVFEGTASQSCAVTEIISDF